MYGIFTELKAVEGYAHFRKPAFFCYNSSHIPYAIPVFIGAFIPGDQQIGPCTIRINNKQVPVTPVSKGRKRYLEIIILLVIKIPLHVFSTNVVLLVTPYTYV